MSEEYTNALPVGTELDTYRVERVLGEGGFGITYLVRELNLGKLYAIKELLPDGIAIRQGGETTVRAKNTRSADDFAATRKYFISEARILAGMNHPAVVKVHRLFETNGTCYMVMDYIEGDTLGDHLKKQSGKLSGVNEFRQIFEPLMSGLEELHGQGIIHRDVKPGNIMIQPDGSPILLDFGAATQTQSKTITITQMLSAGYSPFEQYTSRAKQGPYTDIYALGATMYKCITGKKPDDASDRMYGDTCEALAQTSAYLKVYGSALLGAVDAALRMEPEQRPQTVAEWRKIFEGADATAADRTAESSALASGKIQSGTKRKKVALLSLLAVIFMGAVSWAIQAELADAKKQREQEAQAEREAEAERQRVKDQELAETKRKLAEMEKQAEAKRLKEKQELEAKAKREAEAKRLAEQKKQEEEERLAALAVARGLYEPGKPFPGDFFDRVDKDSIRILAEEGNAKAQFLWGRLHDSTVGLLKNDNEAVKWYRKAAEQGHTKAQRELAACYLYGRGILIDCLEGFRWADQAANAGDAVALYMRGWCHANGYGGSHDWRDRGESARADWRKAADLLPALADQGDARAQWQLGHLYGVGLESGGIQQDWGKAVKWTRKAAEQGLAEAETNLGICYYNGQGIAKDFRQAEMWIRKAAEQGLAEAQYYLGGLAADAYDLSYQETDCDEAVKWFRRAGEQGHRWARRRIGDDWEGENKEAEAQYDQGFAHGYEQRWEEAAKCWHRAAKLGDVRAIYNLGVCYSNGKGVAKDRGEAVKWYRRADIQYDTQYGDGDRLYQECRQGMALDSKAEERAWKEIAKMWRKAAEQGDADSQYNLGLCYANREGVGTGTEQDLKEASLWFRKASEQGHAGAQYSYGRYYANFGGVARNDKDALKWYRKAAGQGHVGAKRNLDIMSGRR